MRLLAYYFKKGRGREAHLVSLVARDSRDGGLSGALGGVNNGLKGGGVILVSGRHFDHR